MRAYLPLPQDGRGSGTLSFFCAVREIPRVRVSAQRSFDAAYAASNFIKIKNSQKADLIFSGKIQIALSKTKESAKGAKPRGLCVRPASHRKKCARFPAAFAGTLPRAEKIQSRTRDSMKKTLTGTIRIAVENTKTAKNRYA